MSIETAKKWILKAENDLKIAKNEFTTKNSATDAICFHAQQRNKKNSRYRRTYHFVFRS